VRGVDVKPPAQVIGAVRKVVGGGDDFIAAVIHEQFPDPFAAPATADHAELDFGVGLRAEHQFRLDERDAGGGRAGQKTAAIQRGAGPQGRERCVVVEHSGRTHDGGTRKRISRLLELPPIA